MSSLRSGEVAALERFVIENDDLVQLETLIGRFNIFDALRVVDRELQHSNFLAWLLNPNESHGAGDVFLKPLLMDVLRQVPPEARPVSPVYLDGATLGGLTIRREWHQIDLLITCRDPSFVLAIENKVYSVEHSDQLSRYQQIVTTEFPATPALFVFLTVAGDAPSEVDWLAYSYSDVHGVLERARRIHADTIGDDVGVVLDHYLRVLGTKFMNDQTIDDLCKRIYATHRQAIDLIVERAVGSDSPLAQVLREVIEQRPEQWEVLNSKAKTIDFMPVSWKGTLPRIGSRQQFDEGYWLCLCLAIDSDAACRLRVLVYASSDHDTRDRIVDRLLDRRDELRLNRKKTAEKKLTDGYNCLGTERIHDWKKGDEPDPEEFRAILERKLDDLHTRWANTSDLVVSP